MSENLWLDLQCLKSLTEKQTFWIDAICIDQNNTIERNHQVELMGQIYRNASRVRVWLGDANEQARGAFFFLQRVWTSSDRIHGIIRSTTHLADRYGSQSYQALTQGNGSQVVSKMSVVGSIRNRIHKCLGKQYTIRLRKGFENQSDILLDLLANPDDTSSHDKLA